MSDDLISREALKEDLFIKFGNQLPNGLFDEIDHAPTVEQKYYERIIAQINPVIEERPQGEWIRKYNGHRADICCTNCGYDEGYSCFKYCPNCGAKMQKGGTNE